MADKPCCAAGAARKIKQIVVDGMPIGLYQLDETMAAIASLGLTNEEEVGHKLLKQIMIYNYVPSKMIPSYSVALLEEYKKYVNTSSKVMGE